MHHEEKAAAVHVTWQHMITWQHPACSSALYRAT